jgi:glutamate--cysteine ligase
VSCTNKEVLKTNDGKELSFYPVEKKGDEIFINNIKPCVILLNNDLSTGIPEILQNIKQPIAPETKFGWHNRTKHNHFIQYDKVVDEFCNKFGIEPYLLRTHHDTVDNVDFSDVDSLTELSVKAESLFDRINDSYKKFNIKEEPFVVVKSNTGTYGMGVITIKNHLDILKLNKNQRKKMKSNKGGLKLNSVLLQEGVPTIERWGSESNTAETVIYLIDGFTVGGFYRTHSKKTHTDSLNSPGMVFAPMSFSIPCCNKCVVDLSMEQNVLYAYGIVARLAAMASTYE